MPTKKKSDAHGRIDRKVPRGRENGFELPPLAGERASQNGTRYEYQIIRNPYVPGEREKMLEKREKLTLEAFRIAYENHHRRKRT